MNTLEYIVHKYKLNVKQRTQPVEIPNTNRESLAQLFSELGFMIGAEIGVEQGIYSEVLLKNNQHLRLYSVDAWAAYEGYRDHMTQDEMDVIHQKAVDRLSPYKERVKIIKGFSTEAVEDFKDNSLDFVYLDANHEFVNVVNDIAAWEKKVKVGGIIAGHDYIKRKTNAYLMHVPFAVHGYAEAYQIKPLFVLGRREDHRNSNPKKGMLRDYSRSWFYVKPEREEMKPGWSGWKDELSP